ncbi:uncharacterized protein [Chelonus insularis]|uniref:uncharacterized protein n=1 Tax=Chelonus insularis TaxID=460826 RepID=UPI00158C60D0|nr:uncharacterized protein LOC118066052 [Chelonus insularis]
MKKCSNGKGAYFHRFFLIFTVFPIVLGRHSHRMVNQLDQNVGSVLFDKNDVAKKCWNNEQLTLLISRNIFQDILPKIEMIDASNEDYIGLIMEYMDVCLEVIKKLTTGRTKRLIMKAFADTMAGYLRVYILPITKRSFYAGNIQYHNAKRLFDLYDELKVFLRTNGIGWFKPNNDTRQFNITPIDIPPNENFDTCSNLLLYPGEGGGVLVPLPFLDDDENPGSIALPFENSSLHSLFTESSAFIVQKYYVASVSCILSSSRRKREISSQDQLYKFLRELNEWLEQVINPHLEDEKWYPAFGGISRVMASIKSKNCLAPEAINPPGIIHSSEKQMVCDQSGGSTNSLGEETSCKSINEVYSTWNTKNIILMALLLAIMSLLLCICIFCCKRISFHKNPPISVIYKNAECTPIKINRFDPHCTVCLCDDDDDDEEEEDEERYLGETQLGSEEERRFYEEKRESRGFISVPAAQSTPIRYDASTDSLLSTSSSSSSSSESCFPVSNSKSSP